MFKEMRLTLAALLAGMCLSSGGGGCLLFCPVAAAQDEQADQAAAQPTDADALPQPEISPAAVEKAHQLLADVARTYQKAQKMRDEIVFEGPDVFTGEPTEQRITIEFYGGTDAMVSIPSMGYTFISKDKTVYVQRDVVPFQYAVLDLKQDLALTVADKDGPGLIFPHFAFKRTSDPKELEKVITRPLTDGKIEGYHRAIIAGEDIHEIYAAGENGDMYVAIDPETLFIKSYTVQLDPDPEHEFEGAVIVFEFHPELAPEIKAPDITKFESPEYTKKISIEQLDYDQIGVGDRLPRITRETPDDEKVQFCQDPDKIYVLVYFSVDGDMSVDAMNAAQQLAQYIEAADLPVELLCCSTLEGLDDDPAEWKRVVKEYMETNEYSMKVVVDPMALAANNHNIGYVPTVIIVGKNAEIKYKFELTDASDVEKIRRSLDKVVKGEE